MRRLFQHLAFLPVLGIAAGPPAAAQNATPVREFRAAMPIETVYARIRSALARCWKDDYDSRVLGPYHEKAEIPALSRGGTTLRMAWHRGDEDRPGPLLQRAFDIRLMPEGAATRVTVLAYIPRSDVGADIEAWTQGRDRCFAGRYPSPSRQ